MVPAGIIGCSDIASELWMSTVAKKQIPDVSLIIQLQKSTFLLTQLHCVFSWAAYVKIMAGFLRPHFEPPGKSNDPNRGATFSGDGFRQKEPSWPKLPADSMQEAVKEAA